MIKAREPSVPRPSVSRETPLVPRSERPFAALDASLLLMIRAHVGKPCPTLRDVRDWTGMPERTATRRIWRYLAGMAERGLIEIEVRQAHPEGGKDPKMRRMRVVGEEWTGWTARRRILATHLQ